MFAAAIVGRESVPGRLRHLLNVESGLNDGLALPALLMALAAIVRLPGEPRYGALAVGEVVGRRRGRRGDP